MPGLIDKPTPRLLERATDDPLRPTGPPGAWSRVAAALVALGVFAAGAVFAWVAFTATGPPQPVAPGPGEVHRIGVDGPPQSLAVGEGAAWVTVGTSGTGNLLWRIDAATEEAEPLPNTRGASWPAVGEGFAWVLCEEKESPCGGPSVLKLDPASGETLATIPLPGYPFQITTGLGAVWVTTFEGLVKIDPLGARVAGVFEGGYNLIGTARGSVWATGYDPDRVYRIDSDTGETVGSVALHDPCTFEASEYAVWVATCDSGLPGRGGQELLTKIDVGTGRVVFQMPLEVHGQMRAVGDSLWIANRALERPEVIQVARLDPKTGEAAGDSIRIGVGEARFVTRGGIGGPHVFVAGDDRSLWLTNFGAGEVIRLGISGRGGTSTAPLPATPWTHPSPTGAKGIGTANTTSCPVGWEEGEDLPISYERTRGYGGGDVLGDGDASLARIVADEARPPECRYFLVVAHTSGIVFYAPIPPVEGLPVVPSLLLSKELDGEPGVELVVDFGGPGHPHRSGQVFTFEAGATFEDGSLIRMNVDPPRGAPSWVLPLGGEDPAGVDCAGDPGRIVVTSGSLAEQGSDDSHYDITRTFYRARGGVYIEIARETHTVGVGTEQQRWPELAEEPFRSCPDYLPGFVPRLIPAW